MITEEYRAQITEYHRQNKIWGNGPRMYIPIIGKFIWDNKITDILDYGCGKGVNLSFIFGARMHWEKYDPGVPEWSADPKVCDHMVCMDVLEHIEPEMLESVFLHMRSKFRKKALLSVSCGPAKDILPDGRNAHLIQEKDTWWLAQLHKYFFVEEVHYEGADNFICIISPHK